MENKMYKRTLERISIKQLKLLCDVLKATPEEVVSMALVRLQLDEFICPAALRDTLADLRLFKDKEMSKDAYS